MKRAKLKSRTIGSPTRGYLLASFFFVVVTPFLALQWDYVYLQTLLACLLIVICIYPTARYFEKKETGIPALAILSAAYGIQFGVPIFTREPTIELAFSEVKDLNSADVVAALIMAIIGIVFLQLGYYWLRQSRIKETIRPVSLPLNKSKAAIYCAVGGLVLPLLLNSRGLIPEQFQLPLSSILRLLQNQIFVVIGVLGWIVYRKRAVRLYTVWLYVLVMVAVVAGMAEGSLESAIVPIAVLFVVKWLHTGRIPFGTVTLVLLIVLFLSPVKAQYRGEVWFGQPAETEQSSGSKAFLWIDKAIEYWTETLSGDRDFVEATSSAASRADLVHQVAHIYSLTPAVVPYQFGGTYSYFAVALIPRALWPNKPTAGSANDFFAVTYGITTEEGIKTTTFGVSLLGEAFINFGWYGVVLVMFLQGLIIGLCQHMFGERSSGAGGQAVFLAFFVFFLNGIGSSAEILFGNLLQNLFCGYVILLWAREKRKGPEISRARFVLNTSNTGSANEVVS